MNQARESFEPVKQAGLESPATDIRTQIVEIEAAIASHVSTPTADSEEQLAGLKEKLEGIYRENPEIHTERLQAEVAAAVAERHQDTVDMEDLVNVEQFDKQILVNDGDFSDAQRYGEVLVKEAVVKQYQSAIEQAFVIESTKQGFDKAKEFLEKTNAMPEQWNEVASTAAENINTKATLARRAFVDSLRPLLEAGESGAELRDALQKISNSTNTNPTDLCREAFKNIAHIHAEGFNYPGLKSGESDLDEAVETLARKEADRWQGFRRPDSTEPLPTEASDPEGLKVLMQKRGDFYTTLQEAFQEPSRAAEVVLAIAEGSSIESALDIATTEQPENYLKTITFNQTFGLGDDLKPAIDFTGMTRNSAEAKMNEIGIERESRKERVHRSVEPMVESQWAQQTLRQFESDHGAALKAASEREQREETARTLERFVMAAEKWLTDNGLDREITSEGSDLVFVDLKEQILKITEVLSHSQEIMSDLAKEIEFIKTNPIKGLDLLGTKARARETSLEELRQAQTDLSTESSRLEQERSNLNIKQRELGVIKQLIDEFSKNELPPPPLPATGKKILEYVKDVLAVKTTETDRALLERHRGLKQKVSK